MGIWRNTFLHLASQMSTHIKDDIHVDPSQSTSPHLVLLPISETHPKMHLGAISWPPSLDGHIVGAGFQVVEMLLRYPHTYVPSPEKLQGVGFVKQGTSEGRTTSCHHIRGCDLRFDVPGGFPLGWLKTLLLTGGFHPWSQDIVRFFSKDSRYIFSVCQYLPSQLVAASTFTML